MRVKKLAGEKLKVEMGKVEKFYVIFFKRGDSDSRDFFLKFVAALRFVQIISF